MLNQPPQISNQMEIFLLVNTQQGGGGDSWVYPGVGVTRLGLAEVLCSLCSGAGHRGHGEGHGDVHDHADGTCALKWVIETTLI